MHHSETLKNVYYLKIYRVIKSTQDYIVTRTGQTFYWMRKWNIANNYAKCVSQPFIISLVKTCCQKDLGSLLKEILNGTYILCNTTNASRNFSVIF